MYLFLFVNNYIYFLYKQCLTARYLEKTVQRNCFLTVSIVGGCWLLHDSERILQYHVHALQFYVRRLRGQWEWRQEWESETLVLTYKLLKISCAKDTEQEPRITSNNVRSSPGSPSPAQVLRRALPRGDFGGRKAKLRPQRRIYIQLIKRAASYGNRALALWREF